MPRLFPLRLVCCCLLIFISYALNHRQRHRNFNTPSSSPDPLPEWNETKSHHKKTCCLIISVDNRPLVKNYDSNHYPSISAVLNHEYAEYHGYDYIYYMNDVKDFIEETRRKYTNIVHEPMMESKQPDKDIATAFHVGLRQFRAASWAKLPPLFYTHYLYHSDYEYIWYIDSDATISPRFRNQSIPEMIDKWNSQPEHYIIKGQKDLKKSSLIFFNNYPWRDDMPCAGSFIFKPSKLMDQIFRQWWDYNLPSKNFKHFHEQDALWHMIESEGNNLQTSSSSFLINSNTYSIMKEQQFPSNWMRYEDLWLVHIASYNYLYRFPILYQFLHLVGKGTEEQYYLAIQHILANHVISLKPLPICEEMERLSSAEKAGRLKDFPSHNEATQTAWYDAHVTSSKIPELPMSALYEGRVIRRRGEFWIVQNGQRRGFQNYQSFLDLKIQQEWAHHMRVPDLNKILDGPLIVTSTMTTAEKTELLKYYQALPPPPHLSSISPSTLPVDSNGKLNFQHSEFFPYLYRKGTTNSTRPRVMMYIISHNNETETQVTSYLHTCCYPEGKTWIKPIQIKSTVFFESVIYQAQLPSLQMQWKNKDYVITATYKTLTKTLHYNQYTQSMASVISLVKIAMDYDYDVIPFLRSGSGMMSFCRYWHGKAFSVAWYGLLEAMGYPKEVIKKHEEIKPFYRNIFIIKAKVLQELMKFMQKAMKITVEDQHIYELMSADSKYKEGTEEVALRIFGVKYYQLFPFVFERLPSFFLAVNNYRVCADTLGPCKYNS